MGEAKMKLPVSEQKSKTNSFNTITSKANLSNSASFSVESTPIITVFVTKIYYLMYILQIRWFQKGNIYQISLIQT